jgi:glycosyltransferase involved in cell wall biosynthesis
MRVKIAHLIGRTAGGGGRTIGLNCIAPCAREFETVALTGLEGDLAEQLEQRGVRVEKFSLDAPARSVFAAPKIARSLKRERPDVVVLHGQPAGFTGAMATRWAGVRAVIYFAWFPSFYTDWDLWRVLRNRVVESVSCGAARRVVCASATTRQQYLLRRLAKESQVVRVPAGIVTAAGGAARDRREVRRRLGLGESGTLVVSVGRLADQKRVDWLVRAWAEVERRDASAELLIVGDGAERGKLEKIARELKLKRCRFLGYRANGAEFFTAADLAVVTTLFEAPGFTVLEAMAAGCPVVATQADGVTEAILDSRGGRLVPVAEPSALANEIGAVLADEGLRARLGEAGQNFVETEHSQERVLAEQFALYREVAAEARGVGR